MVQDRKLESTTNHNNNVVCESVDLSLKMSEKLSSSSMVKPTQKLSFGVDRILDPDQNKSEEESERVSQPLAVTLTHSAPPPPPRPIPVFAPRCQHYHNFSLFSFF